MSRPTIFLDRDGTINVEKNYLHRIEGWEWITGAPEAIRTLNDAGFLVVVASNQAGIARGYYDAAQVDALHTHVDRLLAQYGAHIDAYYYCPHHPDYGEVRRCNCRKPAAGLLLRAYREMDIDLEKSWMIGDKMSDVYAARAAGVTPILVATGYGAQEKHAHAFKGIYKENIVIAAAYILSIS